MGKDAGGSAVAGRGQYGRSLARRTNSIIILRFEGVRTVAILIQTAAETTSPSTRPLISTFTRGTFARAGKQLIFNFKIEKTIPHRIKD